MAKWSDLDAQGIRRCCATFRPSGRCARRVANDVPNTERVKHGDAYCARHLRVGRMIEGFNTRAIASLKK
jgi:hypothetical protein